MCGFFIYFYGINFANMKHKYILLTLFLTAICFGQSNLSLIPMPKNISYQSGSFVLHSKTVIQTNDVTSFEALFLKESIKSQTGLDLKIVKRATKAGATITLVFDVAKKDNDDISEIIEILPKEFRELLVKRFLHGMTLS
jgi:hypothetical protein